MSGETSVAVHVGRAIEHRKSDDPECRDFQIGRRQHLNPHDGERVANSAVSENPCTHVHVSSGPGRSLFCPNCCLLGPQRERRKPKSMTNGIKKSDGSILCAGQRVNQVGLSPTGPETTGPYPKAGVIPCWPERISGGQGVHREVESEGFEENHRVVIEGGYPKDELVGQRQGMVQPAVLRRRRFSSPLSYQGVCRRRGEEDLCVTPGGLILDSCV